MPATAETFTRELALGPIRASVEDDAPIPVTIATTAPVQRFDGLEVLDCSPAGVDLSRQPLSLIVGHDASRLAIGTVHDLQATGERVTGLVTFATSPEAQQVRADVVAGTHRYLSVGYALLDEGTPIEGGMRYRWAPHEVSIVPVPADPAAGFFRSMNSGGTMPTTTEEQEAIAEMATRHGMPEYGRALVRSGVSLARAGELVLEELAQRDRESGGHINIRPEITRGDERQMITDTLAHHMGVRQTERPILRNMGMVDLAQYCMELAGQRGHSTMSRPQLMERALHGTGDFPLLLGDAVGRVLAASFEQVPSAIKALARRIDARDFRARSIIRLGGAPSLERVNEHGEFTYGTIAEASAGWSLATYGRIFGLTRQALVNDDLDGFADMVRAFGDAAARREADELTTILTSPPNIDGAALFHNDHGNLIDDVLDATGLAAAVLKLRKQKGIDGTLVAQEPGTLLVPAALEMKARQLVATINATTTGDVQPYSLDVQVEPRLDAGSAIVWYLVAKGQSALEYGYLEGTDGPVLTTREGFKIDGMEFKARLDFGCGWANPLGWIKSAGTNDHT
ncbi:MAG: hypothetical protein BGO13_02540 [Burkholderiales bacterium 66-5]|nr:MAG: hypothetical protein BGO13_02540 [Burkholderiales bacterium 66-5]